MKRFLLLLSLWIAAATTIQAQDTIRKIDGKFISAKIDSVGKYEVHYHSNADGYRGTRKISRSAVADMIYADGRRDTLFIIKDRRIDARSPGLHQPADTLYQLGRRDAKRYYSRYGGAYAGTLLSTCPGSPVAGLIVGIACSATPPKERNMGFPNEALSQNVSYHEGYYKKARAIKSGKVWVAFGIGVLMNAAIYAIFNH